MKCSPLTEISAASITLKNLKATRDKTEGKSDIWIPIIRITKSIVPDGQGKFGKGDRTFADFFTPQTILFGPRMLKQPEFH